MFGLPKNRGLPFFSLRDMFTPYLCNKPIFPFDPNAASTNFKIVNAIRTAHSFTASKVFVTAPAPWVASDIKGAWPAIDGQPIKAVLSDTLAFQSYLIPSGSKDVNILLSYLWGDESRKNNADINYG